MDIPIWIIIFQKRREYTNSLRVFDTFLEGPEYGAIVQVLNGGGKREEDKLLGAVRSSHGDCLWMIKVDL